jgi:hypothetical protein
MNTLPPLNTDTIWAIVNEEIDDAMPPARRSAASLINFFGIISVIVTIRQPKLMIPVTSPQNGSKNIPNPPILSNLEEQQ